MTEGTNGYTDDTISALTDLEDRYNQENDEFEESKANLTRQHKINMDQIKLDVGKIQGAPRIEVVIDVMKDRRRKAKLPHDFFEQREHLADSLPPRKSFADTSTGPAANATKQ